MHSPRKRFGQHFLSDHAIIERILDALSPAKTDHLVEIGPGQGALTFPLLKRIKKLEAVEIDRDLVPHLLERTRHLGQLEVHNEDVLDFDFANLKKDERPLRIFGNLPYNISTPLIFHLLDYASIISDMLFMLQKEVAERLAAQVSTEHYSRLSIMVQYHCQVELLFDVPRDAFFPPPQVTSSIVRLVPYKTLPYVANDYAKFADLVKTAFMHRRKTLNNTLKGKVTKEIWQELKIDPILRPENLTVENYVTISNRLKD